MSGSKDAHGIEAVARFLRPRSAAIIGMSARPGTVGRIVLDCLKVNQFAGDIHLIGRSAEPVDGRPMLQSVEQLPEGIDLAIFTMPAAGVKDAVAACAKRGVRSAL